MKDNESIAIHCSGCPACGRGVCRIIHKPNRYYHCEKDKIG